MIDEFVGALSGEDGSDEELPGVLVDEATGGVGVELREFFVDSGGAAFFGGCVGATFEGSSFFASGFLFGGFLFGHGWRLLTPPPVVVGLCCVLLTPQHGNCGLEVSVTD